MLTVYKASAGSGKTFTLTYEYIKMLLGYKNENGKYQLNKTGKDCHRAILAITFTNKATAEMKRRIVQELAILAEVEVAMVDGKSSYIDMLLGEFGCTPEELKQSAEKALQELLFDFNFFNISTIDSFFQNVLRVFSREAELAGNYEVELSDEYAIMTGVNQMLASINATGSSNNDEGISGKLHLTDWLKKYMLNIIEEGGGFNMFNRSSSFYENVVEFVNKMCDEEFKLNSELMLKYLEDESRIIAFEQELAKRIKLIKQDIVDKSKTTVEKLRNLGLDPSSCLNKDVRGALLKWANGQSTDLGKSVVAAVENPDNLIKRYLKAYTGDGIIPQDVDAVYLEALEAMVEGIPQMELYKLTRKNIYILGLLGNIVKKIDEYRNDNNLILLSDTNDILQRIISEEELPFIYERVGVNLKHFLIDEFQDTSRMQWQNLSPLISESLSHDSDNLIIGDEKQCIYRFRNSDPSLLREQVGLQFSRQYKERGNNIEGNTNWRSSSDVIKFNNTIFTAIADDSNTSHLYGNVTQQVPLKNKDYRGYVKFTALSGNKAEFEESSLLMMAQEIKRQRQSGYRASDIAILVRKGSEGRRAIDFLLNYMETDPEFPKMKVLSNESLLVGNSNAVKLILSVLKFIDTPDRASDQYHFTARKISSLVNRYEYAISQNNSPSDALSEALASTVTIEDFVNELMSIECISLPSIIERIIIKYVPQYALREENIYITAFQDIITDYCAQGTGDIHSFLKWWDAVGYKNCLTFPDSMDAIKVMTVHKSKGLEFSCVHIPFASWDMVEGKEIKWYDTANIYDNFDAEIVPPLLPLKSSKTALMGSAYEEQYVQNRRAEFVDQLNATYVAFTRAVDELIVNYNISSKDKKEPSNIGDYINQAIQKATDEYCSERVKAFENSSIKVEDVYIPLNACFDDGVLTIGTPTTKKEKSSASKNVEKKVAAIPYYTATRDEMWNLSKVEDLQDLDTPRSRGIILHEILRKVKRETDLPIVIARYVYKNNIPEGDANEITSFLTDSLNDDRVKRWFNGYDKVINERPIVLPTGDSYRPDRIVWTSEGTIEVIDYKFGEPDHDKYAAQVRNYMKQLVSMGYENVKGYIWYLKSSEIVTINI